MLCCVDWGLKGCNLETHCHQSHCVVFLSKILNLLLSPGSTQEDTDILSRHHRKTVDWDLKHQTNKSWDNEFYTQYNKNVIVTYGL